MALSHPNEEKTRRKQTITFPADNRLYTALHASEALMKKDVLTRLDLNGPGKARRSHQVLAV